MHLKKTLCSLLSAGILWGCLLETANAVPMHSILGERQFQAGPIVSAHIVKLQEFILEEKMRLESEGGYHLENIKRLDSLAFGIFCCFCYKNNLTGYIKDIVKQRNPAERREDMDVIENILPENPEQTKELYKRFEITEMSVKEFADLGTFIRICVPKKKVPRGGERKPDRRWRDEMQRGLKDHESGYDADY